MKASVKWLEDLTFVGQTDSGHEIFLTGSTQKGGASRGPSPMEVTLVAAGGCLSINVIGILEKSRQKVVDCVVEVEGNRVDTAPKVFSSIHLHFVVSGHGLDPAAVERAVSLSADKYCSVTMMLGKAVDITHGFEIVEAG
jgi:putative redox protein